MYNYNITFNVYHDHEHVKQLFKIWYLFSRKSCLATKVGGFFFRYMCTVENNETCFAILCESLLV